MKNQEEMALDDYIKNEKKGKKGGNQTKNSLKPSKKLSVNNLKLEIDNAALYKIFAECGPLVKCKINVDKFERSLGSAQLEYEKLEDAVQAVENFNDKEVEGQKLKVKYFRPKQKNDGRKKIQKGKNYPQNQRQRGGRGNSRGRSQSNMRKNSGGDRKYNNYNRNRSNGNRRGRGGRGRGRGRSMSRRN